MQYRQCCDTPSSGAGSKGNGLPGGAGYPWNPAAGRGARGRFPGESPDVGLTADVFREALLEVRMRSRRAARRRGARGSRQPAADPEYQRRLRALGLPVSPLVSRKDRAGGR